MIISLLTALTKALPIQSDDDFKSKINLLFGIKRINLQTIDRENHHVVEADTSLSGYSRDFK